MSGEDMPPDETRPDAAEPPQDEERELERLGEALGYDPRREPPPERVAALRAAAERLRRDCLDPPTRTLRPSPAPPARTDPRPAPSSPDPDGATVVRFPRRRALLLGGVAASLGLGVGAGVTGLVGQPDQPTTEAIAFAGGPAGARTDARLINHSWGTELLLDVSGLDAGQPYQVLYRTTREQNVAAGSFLGVADTVMRCRFNAATLRPDLAAVAVVDDRGDEVMRAVLA